MSNQYVLTSRPDLLCAHIKHKTDGPILCIRAHAADFKPIPEGIKPVCSICVAVVEDREYRARHGQAA